MAADPNRVADPRPRNLARVALKLYKDCDTLVDKLLPKDQVTCTAGCAYCCSMIVWTMLPEALVIARHLRANAPDDIDGIREAIYRQLPLLRDPLLTNRGYYLQHSPCVLLGPHNKCRVFMIRPSECRLYFVISPPENCGDVMKWDKEVVLLNHLALSGAILEEMGEALVSEELPVWVAPLQVNLLWAFIILEKGLPAFAQALSATPPTEVLSPKYWERITVGNTPLAIELANEKRKRQGCK
jgi:Fe-S-cluster containining protein